MSLPSPRYSTRHNQGVLPSRLRQPSTPPPPARSPKATNIPGFILPPDDQEDAGDRVLAAACSVLRSVDNRAMTIKDLGEVCYERGYLRTSVSAASQAISTHLRMHYKRHERKPQNLLFTKHLLSGTAADDLLAPGLYSQPPPGERWRKGTFVWCISPAAGGVCPFSRAGVPLPSELPQPVDIEKKRKRERELDRDEAGPPRLKIKLRLPTRSTTAAAAAAATANVIDLSSPVSSSVSPSPPPSSDTSDDEDSLYHPRPPIPIPRCTYDYRAHTSHFRQSFSDDATPPPDSEDEDEDFHNSMLREEFYFDDEDSKYDMDIEDPFTPATTPGSPLVIKQEPPTTESLLGARASVPRSSPSPSYTEPISPSPQPEQHDLMDVEPTFFECDWAVPRSYDDDRIEILGPESVLPEELELVWGKPGDEERFREALKRSTECVERQAEEALRREAAKVQATKRAVSLGKERTCAALLGQDKREWRRVFSEPKVQVVSTSTPPQIVVPTNTPTDPRVVATILAGVPVFYSATSVAPLTRRIDSDFTNLDSLVSHLSLRKPSSSSLPPSAVVVPTGPPGVKGTWVPLAFARTLVPKGSVRDVFLSETLPSLFPAPLPEARASNKRDGDSFGVPFESVSSTSQRSGHTKTPGARSRRKLCHPAKDSKTIPEEREEERDTTVRKQPVSHSPIPSPWSSTHDAKPYPDSEELDTLEKEMFALIVHRDDSPDPDAELETDAQVEPASGSEPAPSVLAADEEEDAEPTPRQSIDFSVVSKPPAKPKGKIGRPRKAANVSPPPPPVVSDDPNRRTTRSATRAAATRTRKGGRSRQ